MKVVGVLDGAICILIEGARVIMQVPLTEENLYDIKEYEPLPVFVDWDTMESAAYGYPREPKHMGSGIFVHSQFSPKDLVIGDTFSDADFGYVMWDGKDWASVDENPLSPEDDSDFEDNSPLQSDTWDGGQTEEF